nr:hypothetical protein [Tanacetum cinerariifolium]
MNGISLDTRIANQYGNVNVEAAYLQQQMQIAQKEEARIKFTQEEFDFMADASASDTTERVYMYFTSKDTLQ